MRALSAMSSTDLLRPGGDREAASRGEQVPARSAGNLRSLPVRAPCAMSGSDVAYAGARHSMFGTDAAVCAE